MKLKIAAFAGIQQVVPTEIHTAIFVALTSEVTSAKTKLKYADNMKWADISEYWRVQVDTAEKALAWARDNLVAA